MLDWLETYGVLLVALGAAGQLIAGFAAAIAAGMSRRAVRIAGEEAARSRESFQFSSQPLLEVSLDAKREKPREQEMSLPEQAYGPKFRLLPKEAKDMVTDFFRWRQQYSEAPVGQDSPHPGLDYLLVRVRNLQGSSVGQAVDVGILAEFVYADPEQTLQNISSGEYTTRTAQLAFELGWISPKEAVSAWVVQIKDVPALKITVRAIECKTWGEVVVGRGIGGTLDLTGTQATHIPVLVREERLPRDRIKLYPGSPATQPPTSALTTPPQPRHLLIPPFP